MRYIMVIAVLLVAGCGSKQKRCYEKTPSSFATFLDDDWRSYCEEFYEYTENSESVDLVELTTFLTDHAYNSEQLRSRLQRFDNVDSCFSSSSEKLERRRLDSCIADDTNAELQLIDAWKSSIDPFLKELEITISSTTPKLAEAEKSGRYLSEKAADALSRSKKTDRARLDEFQELVDSAAADVVRLQDAVKKYDEVVEASKDNEELTVELQNAAQERVDAVRDDIEKQGVMAEKLSALSGYLQIVEDTAGKSCPTTGVKQVSETKIAIKEMRSFFEKIESGRVRIDKRTKRDTNEAGSDIEKFGGYACGLRNDDDQFVGSAPLCTIHRFEMQRVKEGRRWSAWEVSSKEEGDLSKGIDCQLVN